MAVPYHELLDIDFSNATPWKEDRRNIAITAVLGIPETKNVSMQVDIIPAGGVQKTLLAETAFSAATIRNYSIDYAELLVGANTVIVTFRDEFPVLDVDGITPLTTVFQHDIVVEDRESFAINRNFAFSAEYLISGAPTMTVTDGLKIATESGVAEGIAVPINAIQMDGRAKIHKITVNGEADATSDVAANHTATSRTDRGDSVLQKLPLSDLQTFKAISKIQMTEI